MNRTPWCLTIRPDLRDLLEALAQRRNNAPSRLLDLAMERFLSAPEAGLDSPVSEEPRIKWNVSVNPQLKEAMETRAASENNSASRLVEIAISSWLKEQ